MNITINNAPQQLQDGATVLDALAAIGAKPPFAVAVNTAFVPSAEHAGHLLQAQARVPHMAKSDVRHGSGGWDCHATLRRLICASNDSAAR